MSTCMCAVVTGQVNCDTYNHRDIVTGVKLGPSTFSEDN